MNRLMRRLHLWLALPFGLVVTLTCFSGAMLVFEDEVAGALRADQLRVEPAGAPLPADEVARRVAATLPAGVSVTGVTIPADAGRAYAVSLSQPRRAVVYIDPYTGQVRGRYERPAFFATMFSLHRWLLGSRPEGGGIFWGKMVVGVSTLLFVVVLVTGVAAWWPRTRRALRSSLSITARRGAHLLWHGLHVAGGMYAVLLLLVMALTGLTWSFGWYNAGFYRLFGAEPPAAGHGHAAAAQRGGGNGEGRGGGRGQGRAAERQPDFEHWQTVADELARRHPDFEQITVGRGTASVGFGRLGNQRAADRYAFDASTGRITSSTPYAEAPRATKLRGWIYSLHVGSWGGLATRILWFAAALMGATLPLTGYYLWLRRLSRQRR